MLIAFLLAWWAMTQWLQGFAYYAPLNINVFFIAGGAILLLTLLIVGFQAVKAALANPVNSLRAE
jgi:putative ABC transport system permease protein